MRHFEVVYSIGSRVRILQGLHKGTAATVTAVMPRHSGTKVDVRLRLDDGEDDGWYWESEIEALEHNQGSA